MMGNTWIDTGDTAFYLGNLQLAACNPKSLGQDAQSLLTNNEGAEKCGFALCGLILMPVGHISLSLVL